MYMVLCGYFSFLLKLRLIPMTREGELVTSSRKIIRMYLCTPSEIPRGCGRQLPLRNPRLCLPSRSEFKHEPDSPYLCCECSDYHI